MARPKIAEPVLTLNRRFSERRANSTRPTDQTSLQQHFSFPERPKIRDNLISHFLVRTGVRGHGGLVWAGPVRYRKSVLYPTIL
jgi:hypothetical protein